MKCPQNITLPIGFHIYIGIRSNLRRFSSDYDLESYLLKHMWD